MTPLLTYLGFLLIGFVGGIIAVLSVIVNIGSKSLKDKKAQLIKRETLADRMKRVKEITAEQVELAQRADGPQKNGLDGKHKNSLIGRMKQLDDEKNEVLLSILNDGHDPELTTMDESGTVTSMKLSEYMAHIGIAVKPKPNTNLSKAERLSKFTVHKGGKDDGGSTNH